MTILYTLFVYNLHKDKYSATNFDEVQLSSSYGTEGLSRSAIVPGWGQMYKGSRTKGMIILVGEASLIGGIVIAENLRASYVKKMEENPRQTEFYSTQADNCTNIRNGLIGGAVALYVYNLVDAIAGNGARKVKIGSKGKIYAFTPIVTDKFAGFYLAVNF